MNRKLYETIRDLVYLAEEGVGALENRADDFADRFEVAEGKATVAMGRFYIEEYAEQYRNREGDLA